MGQMRVFLLILVGAIVPIKIVAVLPSSLRH